MTRLPLRLPTCGALAALALGLAACSAGNKGPEPVSAAAPAMSEIDMAIAALDKGDEAAAQKALKPLLKRQPANVEAQVLVESMKQQDPVALLGARSFSYMVQPGDTMLGLSERFLGNRLKFYQLAKYNGVKVPADLAAGTTIKIPGDAPKPATPAAPPPAPKPVRPVAKPGKAKATPATPAAPAAVKAPAVNPALAMKIRGAALSAMNQGKIEQAVALYRRAAALDPANPLIARELARADRIAQTVKARR